jgi:hypothetical protein
MTDLYYIYVETSDELAERGLRTIKYTNNLEEAMRNIQNNHYYEIIWNIDAQSTEEIEYIYGAITEILSEQRIYENNNRPTEWFRVSQEELVNSLMSSNFIRSHIRGTYTGIPRNLV